MLILEHPLRHKVHLLLVQVILKLVILHMVLAWYFNHQLQHLCNWLLVVTILSILVAMIIDKHSLILLIYSLGLGS